MFSRLLRLVFVGIACLACTGGTFTCASGGTREGDKAIVKGESK